MLQISDNFLLAALPFIGVGFIAQLIDGALGMAYGVSSTSLLLGLGVSPAAASASVHTAEVFTTAVSGISHFRFGNVNRDLFLKLIIPGVIGGTVGAYILTSLPGDSIKPFVTIYLLWMGILIVWKAVQQGRLPSRKTPLTPLALVGGFFDAIGGGGWGPVVTSTLVARGNDPRFTIGSVNAAEFFVTVAESVTFFVTMGLVHTHVTVGLLIGGVLAAPLGAYLVRKIPTRSILFLVGILVSILSIRTLVLMYF
ncbi:MAG: sulfite exporter TauE/SafE family protein [Anaerolineales bacterium]|nr:MAG: sulfite exporter TauE/SafE family protein [Anaerolineales bacterium]